MKNIVVIGGGTGQATIMRGLKDLENIMLTAIVTVADDGGSTGRLREQFQIPAMGDVRNVMAAMAVEESIFTHLINFRFEGQEDVGGHNLGNLILTALAKETGNFPEAIRMMSKVMNVKGRILPSTLENVTLYARMEDKTIVRGETNIPKFLNHIDGVFYDHEVKAYRDAMLAVRHADIIIFGLGSLYTSVLPNVIIPNIAREIVNSDAKKIYICNAMSQPGETDSYSLEDHVRAIEKHIGEEVLDYVLYDDSEIDEELLKKYHDMQSTRVEVKEKEHNYMLLEADLLDTKHGYIRHDSMKIRNVLEALINKG